MILEQAQGEAMTQTQIIQERWKKFEKWSLKKGAHSPDSTFCVMEAVAFVAGEPWSDNPQCACPIIAAFLRSWNDALPTDADRDRLLKPLIPLLVNTRNKSLEEKRGIMAADWFIRVHTPAWLRLAGLTTQADTLANLPEITAFAQFPPLRGTIEGCLGRCQGRCQGEIGSYRRQFTGIGFATCKANDWGTAVSILWETRAPAEPIPTLAESQARLARALKLLIEMLKRQGDNR